MRWNRFTPGLSRGIPRLVGGIILGVGLVVATWKYAAIREPGPVSGNRRPQAYEPHPVNTGKIDTSGTRTVYAIVEKWDAHASLDEIGRHFQRVGYHAIELIDAALANGSGDWPVFCKGAAWIDFDNDGYQDLFLNFYTPTETTRLFRNDRNGAFVDVTSQLGIAGPAWGFSCWAWDYDNDGWLDIFASCYDKTLEDMVKGLLGQPHSRNSNRLYHNRQGRYFEDRTQAAGLDIVLVTMGSNFGDFDNDGFLDLYLGTGVPDLEFLDPSRMFKNVAGRRFADITGTSRTGNLQKGHGVACGDWDRDGNTDIFIEMGGPTFGDRYHNILFQNPGQGNHWLTVKLVGRKTNRPAIGARIKVVTAGEKPLTIHRHVTSGSSFGANALQQSIGLAQADSIALLEIYWPTSGTTQVFRNLAVNQAIEITEFNEAYKKLEWQPIPLAK